MRTKATARPNLNLTPRSKPKEQDATQASSCTGSMHSIGKKRTEIQTQASRVQKAGESHQSKGARLTEVLKKNLSPRTMTFQSSISNTKLVQEENASGLSKSKQIQDNVTSITLSPQSKEIVRYVEQSLLQDFSSSLTGFLLQDTMENENSMYITSSRIEDNEAVSFDLQEYEDTSIETRTKIYEEANRFDEEEFPCEEHNPWSQDIFDEMNLEPEAIGPEDHPHIYEGGTSHNVSAGQQQKENIDDITIDEEDKEIFLEHEQEEEKIDGGAEIEDKDIPSASILQEDDGVVVEFLLP